MCVHQAVHPKKNPASLSGQAGRSAGGFTARIKMEAGITLGLTAGYQTDTLTYFFLPLGRGSGGKEKKKKASGSHPVCFLLFKCLSVADGGLQSGISFKKKEGERMQEPKGT